MNEEERTCAITFM